MTPGNLRNCDTDFTFYKKLLVPESFVEFGHYLAASLVLIASLHTVYAGHFSCNDCHVIYCDEAEIICKQVIPCFSYRI
jgi:hypothetical protein